MKYFFNSLLIIGIIFSSYNAVAQHQEISEKPTVWKEKNNEKVDSTSILNAFKNGNFNGHFRYFFMSTNNESGLSDYYANALGGGVKFETAKFHNFQFGVSGYYIFNIGSSNFSKKDPVTNLSNRYEIGLFDIQNPSNKNNLNRLEELHVKYNFKNSNINLGKQLLNTSFINLQDGRMRPTVVDGIWIDFNEIKKTKINLGYLYGISPRSTMKYFDLGIYRHLPLRHQSRWNKIKLCWKFRQKWNLYCWFTK